MALPFLKSSKGKGSVPLDRVKDLTGRGFSEVEVIDILRKEGYSPEEIDNALTQSLKYAATNQTQNQEPETGYQKTEPALPATLEEILPRTQQPAQLPETSLPQEYYQNYQNYPTEEYVDYIVQARIGEVNQKIMEFSVKAEEMEKKVQEVNDRINEIMNLRNAEQTQIISKIESFRESNGDVEVRIGGLEKAFKETLPALIESVRGLTDLVQRLKREA